MVHSSDFEPEQLRRVLADQIAQDQAREFRRYFALRLAAIAALTWLLGWLHLLPPTVFWAVLASAALAIGLMSPSRNPAAMRDTLPTHPPPGPRIPGVRTDAAPGTAPQWRRRDRSSS